MDDYKESVLREVSKLNLKIEKKQKILSVMGILKVKNKSNVLTKVRAMQSIINQCIQCGNYRRAMKLIVATNRFLDEYAAHETSAVDRLTKIILKG